VYQSFRQLTDAALASVFCCRPINPGLIVGKRSVAARASYRIATYGNLSPITNMETVYYGDNLNILRDYIKDVSVDLIYPDPPFNSNRNYEVIFKNEARRESELLDVKLTSSV